MDILSYLIFFAIIAGIYSLSTLGLNLQWGFTGLMNVGIVGFFGVGAYTTAFLTGPHYPDAFGGFGLPIPVGLLGALVPARIFAMFVGVVSIRLRDDFRRSAPSASPYACSCK